MKIRRIITAVAIVALMLPAVAYAQGPDRPGGKGGGKGELGMPRGAWWQRPDVVKELSLSTKQKEKIEALTLTHRKEMIKLRADLELVEVDLDPLLAADKLDEKAIGKKMDEVEAVRAKISRSRMDMLFEIRKVLTRDQYLKLKQLKGTRDKRAKRAAAGKGRPGQQGRPPKQADRPM